MVRNPVISLNRNEIITQVLRRIGAVPTGQSVPSDEVTDAAVELNLLVAFLINEHGLRLWMKRNVTLFTVKGQEKYSLGDAATDAEWALDPTQGSLSAAEAASQTVLSITSTTGMAASDRIGIVLDDNTMQWTTVVTVDSSTQATVTTGLTSAAASGNKIYWYTSRAVRPNKVLRAYRRKEDNTDTEINIYAEEQYNQLPTKFVEGTMNLVYYDPQLTSGIARIWNPPQDSKERLMLVCRLPMMGFDSSDDALDFPEEYHMAIIDGLSYRMAPYYRQFNKLDSYKAIWEYTLEITQGHDREEASTFIQVDNTGQ